MASIRRGYSDDFTLKNNSVGIGTSTGQEALDVVDGAVKGQDLKVTGISSFTAYEGFLRADQQIAENTTLSFDQGPSASLSGEIIVGTGQTVTVNEIVKETAGVGNGSGDQWFDINGNHAFKKTGDPTWNGNTFTFDGTNDHFTASGGDKDDFGFGTGDFTIEMWFNTSVWNIVPYDTRPASTNGDYTTIYIDPNGLPNFIQNGSARIAGSNGDIAKDIWNHIVISRISGTSKMYINGVQKGSDYSDSNNYLGVAGRPFIGAQSRTEGTSDINGQISIVRAYKGRGLTLAEVTLNYNSGYTATTSAVAATVDLNANVPASYPGTVRDVDTTDATRAGGSEIECLKVYNTFTPPSGGTNERPYAPKPGELYYNYDFKTIEFFDGYGWRQVDNTTRSGRGVISTGDNADGNLTSIEVLNVSTLGNSVYFGDTTEARTNGNGVSDGKRGCFGGGYQSPTTEMDTIDYVTMASNGNAIDFGNLSAARNACGSAASSTRGLWMGGTGAPGNPIDTTDYIEIATVGNALDFGNLSANRNFLCGLSNPTRAIAAGGRQPAYVATIEFFIIASKGDATDFGDLTEIRRSLAPATSSTRGVMSNGTTPNDSGLRTIDYITMASAGNAINFGDSTISIENRTGLTNTTRGVFAGGLDNPTRTNVIDYVTIASAGDAIDFGDLSVPRRAGGGASDSHGGLGGF